jgi:hypothetical protein
VNPDRSAAAIGVAGRRSDGRDHIEVVDHVGSMSGVLDRLADLHVKYPSAPIGVDTGAAAGSLVPGLDEREIPFVALTAGEVTSACGSFYDGAVEKTVRHLGQPELNAALSSARKRELAGAWAWHRRDSGDICPLVAVTLARHVFATRVLTGSAPVFAY